VATDKGGEEEAGVTPVSSSSHKDVVQEKDLNKAGEVALEELEDAGVPAEDAEPAAAAAEKLGVDMECAKMSAASAVGSAEAEEKVAEALDHSDETAEQAIEDAGVPQDVAKSAGAAAAKVVQPNLEPVAASGAKWCGWISKCCMSRCSTHLEQTKHSCLSARHRRCRSPGRSRRRRRPSGGQPRAVLMCMNHKSSWSQPISR